MPPWWATWYTRTLLTVIAVLIIIALYNYRIRNIIKQKQKLENIVSIRTAELETKNNELFTKAEELNNSNLLLENQRRQVEKQSNELQLKNEKLKELNLVNERIFSIIAHDIKNPFNALLGFTEILSENSEEFTENKDEIIKHIRTSIVRILELTENLLMWSSSNLKGVDYNPTSYDLNEQIIKNISFIKENSNKKSIIIDFKPKNDAYVFADYNMIDAVFRNIISNAVKYSKLNDSISIAINKKEKEAIISVKDTGIGMNNAEIESLFKFEKVARKVGTMGEQGSGLGLAICYDFIIRNHGRIWVESLPNIGTTFHISLPINNSTSTQIV